MKKKPEIWLEHYNMVKKYYEQYGNSDIPKEFKTINEIDYDENGVAIGGWLAAQRRAYKLGTLSEEQISLLKEINVKLDFQNETWNFMYELAKFYYEHHKNLEVPFSFKTKNGFDYDENGYDLGNWIKTQRRSYKKNELKKERIELLNKIGMRFENIDWNQRWMFMYNLAKKYYEHNGHLEIPRSFRTKNGVDYDAQGSTLGKWIETQRDTYREYNNSTLSKQQVDLLKEIKMRFVNIDLMELWLKNYKLAKNYYEHNGNLEVPLSFKTKNGITYDINGFNLRNWLEIQRQDYRKGLLSLEQIELLNKIEMRFEKIDRTKIWMDNYNLAKNYYNHYGNLDIPVNFATKNGIDYDQNGFLLGRWITTCRQLYKGKKDKTLTDEQIKLLDELNIKWFLHKDEQFQNEEIKEENITRKKIEIINRAKTILNQYKDNQLPSKEQINEDFLEQLNNNKKI